jgi:hypothetical protein
MQNLELSRLDFLCGEWRSTDYSYSEPGGEAVLSTGSASYEWDVGGKWLLYKFQTQLPEIGIYNVHGGFTYESSSGKYKAFAVNSLGLLMVYDGAWESEAKIVFSLVYPQFQPDVRVSYTLHPGGKVQMISERPAVNGGREIYFETFLEPK